MLARPPACKRGGSSSTAMETRPRARSARALAGLLLGLFGCLGSAPRGEPAGATVLVPASAAASAGPAASAEPSAPRARPAGDQEPEHPEVLAFARKAQEACPGVFARQPVPACERSVDRAQAEALLGGDDRLWRIRTMARLALREGEEAGVGRFLLALHRTAIAEPAQGAPRGQRSAACADAATARLLFEAFVPLVEQDPTRETRGYHQALGELAACGDLAALGLVGRVRELARKQVRREKVVGIEGRAYLANPGSQPLRALFFEEYEAAAPQLREAMIRALEEMDREQEPAVGAMCSKALTYLAAAEGVEVGALVNLFAQWSGACFAHRERYLDLLQTRLRERSPFRSPDALFGLVPLCHVAHRPSFRVHGVAVQTGVTPAQQRRTTELALALAGPDNTDPAARAVALEALCACDRVRARPLVNKAKRSSNDREREAAQSDDCQ